MQSFHVLSPKYALFAAHKKIFDRDMYYGIYMCLSHNTCCIVFIVLFKKMFRDKLLK